MPLRSVEAERAGAISALAVLPLKAVPHPEQQPPGGLDLLLRQGPFEEGSDETQCALQRLFGNRA